MTIRGFLNTMKIELDDILIKRLENIIEKCDLAVEFTADEIGYSNLINGLFEEYIDNEFGVDEESLYER